MSGNPFNKPFRFPMPADVSPAKTVCFKMEVPDDPQHIANLLGALWQLCYGRAYADNVPGTVKQVIQTWRTAYNTISFDDCDCPPAPISEDDYEMSLCEQLRYHNGVLQALCCGVWTDITGQPAQGVGNSQPGQSPQPSPGGGCQDYMGDMGGASPWYVPTVVSTGDTINIHDTSGVFYDNHTTFWFCADGGRFFVNCTNQNFFDAGSQIPAVPIGRIVAKIGPTYYDVFGSVFTVPSGHASDPVQLEMNTPSPTGSGGDVSFTVTVCNNAPATWTHTFDFTLSPGGFVLGVTAGGNRGIWTAGQGWTNTDDTETLGEWVRGAYFLRDGITPFTMTSITLSLDDHQGTFRSPAEYGIGLSLSNGDIPINLLNPAVTSADNQVLGGPWSASGITSITVQVATDTNVSSPAGFTGSCRVFSLTVSGVGVSPFS